MPKPQRPEQRPLMRERVWTQWKHGDTPERLLKGKGKSV
jgi:hypothetical protein